MESTFNSDSYLGESADGSLKRAVSNREFARRNTGHRSREGGIGTSIMADNDTPSLTCLLANPRPRPRPRPSAVRPMPTPQGMPPFPGLCMVGS